MSAPLPPRPNFLTDEERATLDPKRRLNPMQKGLFLATLAAGLQRQLTDDRLQPIVVTVDTRPTGFTLTVEIPPPSTDQLVLP